MSKYKQIEEMVPVTLKKFQHRGIKWVRLNFACCDCGLVHGILIEPRSKKVRLWFSRDNRRTANLRRSKKFRGLTLPK